MSIVNSKVHLNSKDENLEYWEKFYKKFKIDEESSFCQYVKSLLNSNTKIIDLGCGTGRDSHSFSKEGFSVTGVDRSFEAIALNNNYLNEIGENQLINFKRIDISDKKELMSFINKISEETLFSGSKLLIYSRFLLHSINEESENILLSTMSETLKSGDLFASEFRTVEDESRTKVYGDHYRRYINSDQLVKTLESEFHFKVIEYSKGTGYSIYKEEDPFLARIIAKKV